MPSLVGVRGVLGNITVYRLTAESVRPVKPGYSADSPELYTTFLAGANETVGQFLYDGSVISRVLFQRAVLGSVGVALVVSAAVPHD